MRRPRRPGPTAASPRLTAAATAVWTGWILWAYVSRAVIPSSWPWSQPAPWPPGGPGGIAAALAAVLALFPACILAIAAAGAGLPFLGWLSPGRAAGPVHSARVALAAAFGLGLAGIGVLGLGFAGLVRVPVLATLLTAGGVAFMARRGARTGGKTADRSPDSPVARRLLAISAAAALAGLVLGAISAECDIDSLKYHLPKADRYIRDGRLALQPDLFDRWPSLWEALISIPLGLGGEPAAKATIALVAALAAVLLWRTAGAVSGLAGALAGALWITADDVARLGATSKNDLLVALFVLAGFCAPRVVRGGRRASIATGFCLGCALATKPTASLGFFAVGAVTIAGWNIPGRPGLAGAGSRVILLLTGAVAAASPWHLRDWLETRNPVYPFAGWLFGTGFTRDSAPGKILWSETRRYVAGSYAGVLEKLRAPWTVAITERHALLPLLSLPVALSALARRGSPARPWAAASLSIVAMWTMGPPQGRFLLQAIPLLCGTVSLAVLDPAAGPRARAAGLAVGVAVAGLEAARGWTDIWTDRISRAGCAAGLGDPAEYRRVRLRTFGEAAGWANERLPLNASIIVYGDIRVHPLARRVRLRTEYEPFQLLELAAASKSAKDLDRRIRQTGLTHLFYDRIAAVGRGAHLDMVSPPIRALPVWATWWRTHARLVYETPAADLDLGAFSIFSFDRRMEPGRTVFLPGVEGWLWRAERLRGTGRAAEARELFGRIRAAAGDFAFVKQAEVAIFEADLGKERSRALLKEAESQGLRTVWLMTSLARMARDAGDEAEAASYRAKAEALVWKP